MSRGSTVDSGSVGYHQLRVDHWYVSSHTSTTYTNEAGAVTAVIALAAYLIPEHEVYASSSAGWLCFWPGRLAQMRH